MGKQKWHSEWEEIISFLPYHLFPSLSTLICFPSLSLSLSLSFALLWIIESAASRWGLCTPKTSSTAPLPKPGEAFVSVPAQLHSVSVHACTWSTFKSLYLQPLVGVNVHVLASKHPTIVPVFYCVCVSYHICLHLLLERWFCVPAPGHVYHWCGCRAGTPGGVADSWCLAPASGSPHAHWSWPHPHQVPAGNTHTEADTHPVVGTHIQTQRVMNMLEKLHLLTIYNLSFILYDPPLSCMQTLTCNGLHITSNIWIHLWKSRNRWV